MTRACKLVIRDLARTKTKNSSKSRLMMINTYLIMKLHLVKLYIYDQKLGGPPG